MRIKDNEGKPDSLDHCYSCPFKKNCKFLEIMKKESKGIQVIIIQYCSEAED